MQTSGNYGLKLFEGTDNVKRQDFVDNFSTIDTQMKVINDNSYPTVTATGTNTYVGTSDRIKAIGKGTKLTLFVGADATGNCTLNLNSYGAKNIKDSFGNIVTNLKSNIPYNICYNGTDFILQGKGGGGNATAAQITKGATATVDGGPIVGTLDLSSLVSGNIRSGVTINGITGKSSVVDTSDALATAAQILAGVSAYVNGNEIVGNMPNHTGADSPANSIAGTGPGRIYVRPQYGYYDGSVASYVDDANFVASNIISGKSIFGIAGGATIESLGGRRAVPGTSVSFTYNKNQQVINIASAIPFTPTVICGTRYNSALGRDAVTFCYYLLNGVYHYMIESALSDKVIFGSGGSTLLLSSLEVYGGSLINYTYNWIAIE